MSISSIPQNPYLISNSTMIAPSFLNDKKSPFLNNLEETERKALIEENKYYAKETDIKVSEATRKKMQNDLLLVSVGCLLIGALSAKICSNFTAKKDALGIGIVIAGGLAWKILPELRAMRIGEEKNPIIMVVSKKISSDRLMRLTAKIEAIKTRIQTIQDAEERETLSTVLLYYEGTKMNAENIVIANARSL